MNRKLILIAIYIVLIIIVKMGHEKDLELRRSHFIQNYEASLINIHEKLQDKINLLYQGLRTISRMPSVRKMEENSFTIHADSQKSMLEIYENLSKNVALSEIYLVPSSFDPDKLDPKTKKMQIPAFTFDSILKKKIAELQPLGKGEEIENFEYKVMREQILAFKKEYPNDSKIDGFNIPMQTSQEVITCDNSYYDIKKADDKARSGLVLSVPIYNQSGNFTGLVSGIILTKAISSLLPPKNFKIESKIYNYEIGDLTQAKEKLVFEAKTDLNFYKKNSGWILTISIPESKFLNDPDVLMAQRIYFLRLFISTLIMLGVYYLFEQNNKLIDSQRRSLEASARLSLLGEMAASIAHEINNPLSIIIAKTTMMNILNEKGTLTKERITTDIDKIQTTAERIAKIIRGLKSLSRNVDTEPLAAVSLKKIVNESLEFCQDRLKERSVELRNKCELDDLVLCRDIQISQVIINLVNNGSDAISKLDEKWIELELTKDIEKKKLILTITDSGGGIPPEIAKKLMTAFFTTKEVGKGTGLGLSISRKILREHGGDLTLDQGYKNTRFVIELPLHA